MFITVDIGGTKIALARYVNDALLETNMISTETEKGQDSVIERLLDFMADAAGNHAVEGIGLACPGPLSASKGIVIHAPCLGWRSVPIVKIVQDRFHCPVILENDANAAAFGEYLQGAGRGASSMAYITVSTGVGCGMIINGSILQGFHDSAGEIGHLTLYRNGKKCPCGKKGCLERYASGTAIGEEASKILKKRNKNLLPITAKEAAVLAKQGDDEMRQVFIRAGEALGYGIAALLQLTDVECVVIGGSVSKSFDLMEYSVRRIVAKESYWGKPEENWLRLATLDGKSGLIGAAELIKRAVVETSRHQL